MLQRFWRQDGRTRLVEALETQSIVSGDTAMAKAFSGYVEVVLLEPGSSIMEETARLYLILADIVSIRIADREIAIRTAGQHVVEMALLDPANPRTCKPSGSRTGGVGHSLLR